MLRRRRAVGAAPGAEAAEAPVAPFPVGVDPAGDAQRLGIVFAEAGAGGELGELPLEALFDLRREQAAIAGDRVVVGRNTGTRP